MDVPKIAITYAPCRVAVRPAGRLQRATTRCVQQNSLSFSRNDGSKQENKKHRNGIMNMHQTDPGHDCPLPVLRTRLSGRAPRIIEVIRHSRPYGLVRDIRDYNYGYLHAPLFLVFTCLAMFSIYYDQYIIRVRTINSISQS